MLGEEASMAGQGRLLAQNWAATHLERKGGGRSPEGRSRYTSLDRGRPTAAAAAWNRRDAARQYTRGAADNLLKYGGDEEGIRTSGGASGGVGGRGGAGGRRLYCGTTQMGGRKKALAPGACGGDASMHAYIV